MMVKDTVGSRILKHGLCAITMGALLFLAVAMGRQVYERSFANFAFQAESVNAITIDD